MAAGDARFRDPREHGALGETVLVHPGHVSRPEQRATHENIPKQLMMLLEEVLVFDRQ